MLAPQIVVRIRQIQPNLCPIFAMFAIRHLANLAHWTPISGRKMAQSSWSIQYFYSSMAHSQRMSKLAELIQSGDVDQGKPVFEQPEPHPPQRTIGEAAKERRKVGNCVWHLLSEKLKFMILLEALLES